MQTDATATVLAYNDMIVHETLRVAVLDNVRRESSMPPALRCVSLPRAAAPQRTPNSCSFTSHCSEVMLASFMELQDSYIAIANAHAARLDGQAFAVRSVPRDGARRLRRCPSRVSSSPLGVSARALQDPLSRNTGTFMFAKLRDEIVREGGE